MQKWARDNGLTYDLLSLCGGHGVDESDVATWTDEQCRQAEEWASREHLSASDNDEVGRIPMPAHVAAHPPKPRDGLW